MVDELIGIESVMEMLVLVEKYNIKDMKDWGKGGESNHLNRHGLALLIGLISRRGEDVSYRHSGAWS